MQETGRPSGIEQLVERWRTEFRRPENTNFYDAIDYKKAERKYIKLCLDGRVENVTDGERPSSMSREGHA